MFGDMPNDLPLFAWSRLACAGANAHPSVLAAAEEVVPSNGQGAVALTAGISFLMFDCGIFAAHNDGTNSQKGVRVRPEASARDRSAHLEVGLCTT